MVAIAGSVSAGTGALGDVTSGFSAAFTGAFTGAGLAALVAWVGVRMPAPSANHE